MTPYLDGLTERDLGTLAAIVKAEPEELTTELRRRPWWIHDLLGRPDVFEKVLDRHALPAEVVSPFLLFSERDQKIILTTHGRQVHFLIICIVDSHVTMGQQTGVL